MKIKHLEEIGMSYSEHLFHAWRMSIILFVHGIAPMLWKHKVSNEIIDYNNSVEKR
jgi:hypothetical protein